MNTLFGFAYVTDSYDKLDCTMRGRESAEESARATLAMFREIADREGLQSIYAGKYFFQDHIHIWYGSDSEAEYMKFSQILSREHPLDEGYRFIWLMSPQHPALDQEKKAALEILSIRGIAADVVVNDGRILVFSFDRKTDAEAAMRLFDGRSLPEAARLVSERPDANTPFISAYYMKEQIRC